MMTDRDFLERLERLFQQAMDVDPAEQFAFLRKSCEGDERLRIRVQALLDTLEKADAGKVWNRTALDTVVESSLDTDLGRYRLQECVGAGGMGAVYKAVRADDEFSKLVAVKLVLIPDETLVVRFRRERQMLASLEHPNIARLLDGGTSSDGAPFLVMEYVDGVPIDRYVATNHLSILDTLALFRKVCSAVSYAHRNLIVHRDLKPANILVDRSGEPKLLDFGIAKLMDGTSDRTKTAFLAMTPEYASPEQIRGQAITTASDVYSLGVVLYEVLTGSRPYRPTQSALDLAEAITKQQPATLSTSQKRFDAELENIVQMALRKEPERRYASVDLLSEDVHSYMTGLPVLAHRDTFFYRTGKFVRRHAAGVAAGALLLLTLLAGIAGTAWQAHIARIERARAERRFNDVRKLADSYIFEFNASIEGIPGTLAARQLLVRRALEYLDSLAREAGDDRALKNELADAYEKVGTITFDVAARLDIHKKELAIRESLARAEPANRAYQRQLAASYISVGDATKDTGNLRGALENYRSALRVTEPRSLKEPKNAGLQLDTGNALELIGQILDRMGEIDESFTTHSKALAVIQNAIGAGLSDPEFPQLLMVIHHSLAHELTKKGDYTAALAETREGLSLAEQMSVADPANATNRRNLWVSNMRLSELIVKTGDLDSGLAYIRKALPYIRALAAADPGDKGHARGLAVTYLALADTLAGTGKLPEAFTYYKQAIATSEALLRVDPHKLETRADLAGMYTHLGMCYIKSGDRRSAAGFLRTGRAFFDQAAAADPANADIQRGKAEADAQLAALEKDRSPR